MDDFLNDLVADLKPVRRRQPRTEALMLGALGLTELALWLLAGQARPHLMQVISSNPAWWWKIASFGLVATLSAGTAIASLNPAISPRKGLIWTGLAFAAYLGVGALIGGPSDPQGLLHRLNWREGIVCLTNVIALSAPIMAGLGVLMRKGAPAHRGATALASGVAAAAWAAFVFTFACPHDDALYVTVWYTLGCALSAGLARLALPVLTRW